MSEYRLAGDKTLWTKVGEMTVANRKNTKEYPKKA